MTSAMSRPEQIRRRRFARAALVSVLVLISYSEQLEAQDQAGRFQTIRSLAWSTDSTGPRRFISVHGRRAAIFGYPQGYTEDYSSTGLEVWAYPVQILSSYCVTFRQPGTVTSIDGQTILRRIVYSPEAVTRVYAGPDFIVREKLFVPLDETGAIIRYEVESAHPIDIEIRFIPVLDLMWPASIGGQDAVWSSAASAYLLSELTHRFAASVGSPDIVAHDETPNSGQHVGRAPGLAFTIRAGGGHNQARVIIAGSGPGLNASAIATKLLKDGDSLEKAAVEHYDDLLNHALQIETPDADTNRALAWSEIALDQAWVCNPDLGCGLVAGYGPSRSARRPQYDWFFAGDGMIAVQALLAAGEYDRARHELEFIFKRQDQKTGMVWHELSQSAGLLDWTKYPYMFVHVDLTFDFLNTVGNYFSATGDRDFVKAHWTSIQSAYEYCRSLLDAKDGLPRIPAEKEGGREQDQLTDELALSASWAGAAQAFADLSAATGHNSEAAQAGAASLQAIHAIGQRYWDERRHSWIAGYTHSGTPLIDRGIGPTQVRGKALFSEAQIDSLIGQLASSDFQADWGARGNASSAGTYDPDSYSRGSVWAVITAGTASQFWAEHRPATALPIWSALVPWSSLDSLGHMHEVVAGNFYHEEVESVPEQTWSSAGFFTAAVNGLLGLQVDGVSNRVTFAPHLPPNWNTISLRNLHVGASEISVRLFQSTSELRLEMNNKGAPVEVVFNPEIPLGAKLRRAQFGDRPITAMIEEHPQDEHAKVEFNLPHGSKSLTIGYKGGVALIPDPPRLLLGEASKALKITGINLRGGVYTVDVDYLPSATSGFELRTPWTIKDAQGATFEEIAPALYRLTVSMPKQEKESDVYQHGKVIVTFAHEKSD
jgi:glycogen debranching enzyme